MELLSEYGPCIDVIAIKIVTPEIMERYGLTEEHTEATPEETTEPTPEQPDGDSQCCSSFCIMCARLFCDKNQSEFSDCNPCPDFQELPF